MPRHYKMTDSERRDRRWARKKIVAEANRIRVHLGTSIKPYSMRRIQDAVCVVRRRMPNMVNDKDLVRAGFNPR